MKKIVYSSVTKFICILLLLVCCFQTVCLVTNCIISFFGSEREVYMFEESFEDSSYMSAYLNDAIHAVFSAFMVYNHDDAQSKTLDELVKEYLDNVSEHSEYRVVINDAVFESREGITKQEILSERFNIFFYKQPDGEMDFSTTGNVSTAYYWAEMQYLKGYNIEIYCSLDDDFVNECEKLWIYQKNIVYKTFKQSISLVLVFIVMLVYLICVCGKKSDGQVKEMWLDRIPIEVHLAFIALFVGLGLGLPFILFDEFFSLRLPQYFVEVLVPLSATLSVFFVITSLLSLIRKLKCKTFLKTSIIFLVLKVVLKVLKRLLLWLLDITKRVCKALVRWLKLLFSAFSSKTSFILLCLLLVYTALILFCAFLLFDNYRYFGMFFVMLVIVVLLAAAFVTVRARDFELISKGASEIRRGNLSYVVKEPKSEDMKLLANNINEIAKGLDESVAAKMRAERLKTELVTNVSHDLKTPLTSIINYTELLSELENLPEEARDYVKIIAKKSDRLKTLTQDLFDISKIQSGNENINLEKLDISLLVSQSLGEHDKEIEESGIIFVTGIQKELLAVADGRKMSRVVSNLIGNILKYAMKGTRAFVTTRTENNKVVIEFKNISAYPMDFAPDEISARFVRGDKSRSEEGSGLGLAIAKSYTEACGGSFDIILDGDMFKVLISFDSAK